MNKITLTEAGKRIIAGLTGTTYWVGYYGLAYVPDNKDLGDEADNQTTLIGAGEKGDYIYNIWQGDLTTLGYPDGFEKLTMYDKNVCSNYRYMFSEGTEADPCPRNNLVAWETNADNSYTRKLAHVYRGVRDIDTGNTIGDELSSELPLPAPLLYVGKGRGYGDVITSESAFAAMMDGDYPKDENDGIMVSPDMRFYEGDVVLSNPDDFGATKESGDDDGFMLSSDTRVDGSGPIRYMNQYGKMISVSKYNKSHGHVSSEGYEVNGQESSHNISRATRLFPISSYEVVTETKDGTNDPETVDKMNSTGKASVMRYNINLDLKRSNKEFMRTIEFENGLPPEAPEEDRAAAEELFDGEGRPVGSKGNSFRFNRVGIYAVPVAVHRFLKEGDSGSCSGTHVQIEVFPDEEPVLIAVYRISEFSMSDDGSFGSTEFNMNFELHLETAGEETDVVNDVDVFYNMHENQAITWYENQLLATAGLSEAVTSLGIDVAYLKTQQGGTGECAGYTNNDGDLYASKNHTHDYMKNLVDGVAKSGSVRGINTATENSSASTGENAMQLGSGTAALGDRGLIQGRDSTIEADSADVIALGVYGLDVDQSSSTLFTGVNKHPDAETDAIATDVSESIVTGGFTDMSAIKNSLIMANGLNGKASFNDVGGSILGGEFGVDNVKQSVVLRYNEDLAFAPNQGKFNKGIMLGEGYSWWNGAKFDTHPEVTYEDESILTEREIYDSIAIATCRHYFLTESERSYHEWTRSYIQTDKTPAQLIVESASPKLKYSIIDGMNVRGKVSSTVATTSGGSTIGEWSINDIGADGKVLYTFDCSENLVAVNGSAIGMRTQHSIIVGGGLNTPTYGDYNLWIGAGCGTRNEDTAIEYNEFIEKYGAGTLAEGNYVILTDPDAVADFNIQVYDPSTGTASTVTLQGSNGYNAGVRVDSSNHIYYTPVVDRKMPVYRIDFSQGGIGNEVKQYDITRLGDSIETGKSGYGDIAFTRANPVNINYTINIGGSNNVGSGSEYNMILGGGNSCRTTKMTECLIFGHGIGVSREDETLANELADGKPRLHELKNVKVLSSLGNNMLGGLMSRADLATTDYSDALIFLNDKYNLPEILGIFPNPTYFNAYYPNDTSTEATVAVTAMKQTSFFFVDPTRFDANGQYQPVLDTDPSEISSENGNDPNTNFRNKTFEEIKKLVNKPEAPMVYTGGICLAGKPNSTLTTAKFMMAGYGESNAGLLKLGSGVLPCAYVQMNPVSGWFDSNDFIIPVSVTGTTDCPYGGYVLGITNQQEWDGTMHLGLFKLPAGGGAASTEFTSAEVDVSGGGDKRAFGDWNGKYIMLYGECSSTAGSGSYTIYEPNGPGIRVIVDSHQASGYIGIRYCGTSITQGHPELVTSTFNMNDDNDPHRKVLLESTMIDGSLYWRVIDEM